MNDRTVKAEVTRDRILQVAGEEMERVGFRAMGLNDILKKLKMSKGALYHHFKNKLELGYAILDELYVKHFLATWVLPLDADDPLQAMIDCLNKVSNDMTMSRLECGCPINNLSSEMSQLDEGFRLRVEGVYKRWKTRMTESFLRAQKQGLMKEDADAERVSVFVIASMQGAIGLAKNAQKTEIFSEATLAMVDYLESLQVKSGQRLTKLTKGQLISDLQKNVSVNI